MTVNQGCFKHPNFLQVRKPWLNKYMNLVQQRFGFILCKGNIDVAPTREVFESEDDFGTSLNRDIYDFERTIMILFSLEDSRGS
jgi:hypothetical protein